MSSLTKALGSTSYSRSNLLISGAVLVFVFALFFIPELIDFEKTFGGKKSNTASIPSSSLAGSGTPAVKITKARTDAKVQPAKVSPLVQIIALLESRQSGAAKRGQLGDGTKAQGEQDSKEPQLGDALSKKTISWEDLKQKETVEGLRNAQSQAIALSKELPEKDTATRFALLNYGAGIEKLMQNLDGLRNPQEALDYLSFLDNTVTTSMVREGVERGAYLKWQGISLGTALDNVVRSRQRAQFKMAFNPQLRLEEVALRRPTADGIVREDTAFLLSFRGFVVGADVDKIEIFQNGKLTDSFRPPDPDELGRRYFQLDWVSGWRIYTIRVSDPLGNSIEKNYSFADKIDRLPYNAATGFYILPVRSGRNDTSMDRFFRYRGGKGGRLLLTSGSGFQKF